MTRLKTAAKAAISKFNSLPPKTRRRILVALAGAAVAYGLIEAERADLLLGLAFALIGG